MPKTVRQIHPQPAVLTTRQHEATPHSAPPADELAARRNSRHAPALASESNRLADAMETFSNGEDEDIDALRDLLTDAIRLVEIADTLAYRRGYADGLAATHAPAQALVVRAPDAFRHALMAPSGTVHDVTVTVDGEGWKLGVRPDPNADPHQAWAKVVASIRRGGGDDGHTDSADQA